METIMENIRQARIIDYHNGRGVPVHFYLDEALMPDERALRPLAELSALPEVDQYLVALPDLHYKSRNLVPTGLVSVSQEHVIPFAVDKGINCGIRIMSLPLGAGEIDTACIDRFYSRVMQRVAASKHAEPTITKDEVRQIILRGAEWAADKFHLPREALLNYEKSGNLFRDGDYQEEEILDSLPAIAAKRGQKALGVLGGGNHFLELQQISEIVDSGLGQKLGLAQDQLILMLHTGTGGFGGSILKYYHQYIDAETDEKAREKLRQKREFLDTLPPEPYRDKWFQPPHLYAIPAESATARRFIAALYAVANFGFANRAAISYHAEQALQEALRHPTLRIKLLYDSSHVTIQQEQHHGAWYWVHRNGANQAMPASRMADHPLYRDTGQPIPVPGSMGTDSYIAVAAEGAEKTFCSANHGAGRLLDKPEAREAFVEQEVEATMQQRGIRLYRYGKDHISEQAPEAFKDITNVLRVMQQFRIARAVARVRPLAVLKG